jgi:Na+/H+-dicarboxylate symporter
LRFVSCSYSFNSLTHWTILIHRSIVYYFTTTVCAVILGIILVTVIRPGDGHKTKALGDQKVTRDVLTADTLLDLVR